MPTYSFLDNFNLLLNKKDVTNIKKKILFLSIPRSGSTFLCDVLTKHGGLGFPEEWLNPVHINEFSKYIAPQLKGGSSLKEYCWFLLNKTSSENGYFSTNMHVYNYKWWREKKIDWIEELGFDHVYFISRKDKYAQAYSYALANVTADWRQMTEKKRGKIVKEVTLLKVLEYLKIILEQEMFYEQELKSYVQREFFYEDFAGEDLEKTVQTICEDVGISFTNISESKYKVQRYNYDQSILKEFRNFMRTRLSFI